MPPVFERLGRELEDGKVLVLCRYISAEPRIWDWLGQAGQARILAKVDCAPVGELVEAMWARQIIVVAERLLARLGSEVPSLQETFLGRYPCRSFVAEVLSHYGRSGSYAAAEQRGASLLLPHAGFLVVADIQRLDEVIRGNAHDQILRASGTARILTQVLDQTSELLPGAAPHWAAIADYIVTSKVSGDYAYPEFLAELRKAGVSVPKTPAPQIAAPDDSIF